MTNYICNPGYIGTNCQFSCVDSKIAVAMEYVLLDQTETQHLANAIATIMVNCSQYNSSCTSSNYCKHDSCCTGTDQCACKVATPPETQYGKQCNIQETNCSTTNCNGRGSCLSSTVNPFALSCKCNEPFSGPNCNVCSNKGEDYACTTGCWGLALMQGMGVANAIVIIIVNASFIMQGVWMKVIVTMVVVALLQIVYPTGIYGPTCDIFLKDCDAAIVETGVHVM